MDFTQPWDFGDVTFIVEDRKIYVNKGNLAMSSEVFRAMFTSECKGKKMTEIPLRDKKFDDVLQLMQILQPLSDTCVDDTNVENLLPLAHEYQVHQVVKRCEQVLVKQPPSIHNLILADKFSLTELRQVFLKYMKDVPINMIQNDSEFEMLDDATRTEVFEHHSMYQQPSIKNLFLADKYKEAEVYERCLQYIKDTPMSQLKAESGFIKFDYLEEEPAIAHEDERLELDQHYLMFQKPVPTHKYETLHRKVKDITSWVEIDEQEHDKCKNCRVYLGATMDCIECKAYRFDVIADYTETTQSFEPY